MRVNKWWQHFHFWEPINRFFNFSISCWQVRGSIFKCIFTVLIKCKVFSYFSYFIQTKIILSPQICFHGVLCVSILMKDFAFGTTCKDELCTVRNKIKTVMQIWNNMRVHFEGYHFCVNYPFKLINWFK